MHTPAHFGEFATLLRGFIRFSSTHSAGAGGERELESAFDRLALSLFRLQFSHNAAYRRLCEARKLTPRQVEHWNQIPSVTASAFKEWDLSCLALPERTAVFHSSGTTGQRPSRHFHGAASLAVYEASLWPWFARHLIRELNPAAPRDRLLMLTPPPEVVPHSSLVHMFDTVKNRWKWSEPLYAGNLAPDGTWTVNTEVVRACLERAVEMGQTILILGTAFSFVHLLDHLQDRGLAFRLPNGSRVMETGGYKGRSRTLERPELHALIARHLGISPEKIVCEYGMSELSSQAYDHSASREAVGQAPQTPVIRRFRFPPWARLQIISPEHGREVGEGETGLIRVIDLANVYSVLAIQTEDLGIRRGQAFELIGRGQAAEPRGCSLAAA